MAKTYRDSRGLLSNVRPKVDHVLAHFPATVITHVWTSGSTPDHNNLRCCDFMVPTIDAGNSVENYLRANSSKLGIMGIIWNRRVTGWPSNGTHYSGPEGVKRVYNGASPHRDHLHVEFNNSQMHSMGETDMTTDESVRKIIREELNASKFAPVGPKSAGSYWGSSVGNMVGHAAQNTQLILAEVYGIQKGIEALAKTSGADLTQVQDAVKRGVSEALKSIDADVTVTVE